MKVLVVLNSSKSGFPASDLKLLGFFEKQNFDVCALAIGERPEKSFHSPLHLKYTVFDKAFAYYHPEALAFGMKAAIKKASPSLVVSSATLKTKDFFPYAAANLHAVFLNEVIAISKKGEALIFKKPLHAGKVLGDFKVEAPLTLALVSPNQLQGEWSEDLLESSKEEIPLSLPPTRLKHLSFKETARQSKDLTEAEMIVSGGRGNGKWGEF